MHTCLRWCAALPLFLVLSGASARAATLSSPDGHISVRIEVKDRLEPYPPGPRLYYSVALDGRDVLLDSSLALDFKDAAAFGRNVRIAGEHRQSIDSTWQTVVGKSRDVRDRANELTLSILESDPPRRHLDLVFRAYDDGVAFRWVLPAQPGLGVIPAFRRAQRVQVRGQPHRLGRELRQLYDIAGRHVSTRRAESDSAWVHHRASDAGEGPRHRVGGAVRSQSR